MRTRTRVASFHHIALIPLLLTSASAALAQSGDVSVIALSAGHRLLGDPLIGGGASLRVPRRDGWLTLRFGAEQLRGRAERIGIPCAGLIFPGTCPPELLRDDVRIVTATSGAAFRLLGGRHATVALTADLGVASLRADTHGLASGTRLAVRKALWGGLLGAEAVWTPVRRVPLALAVGGAIGALTPVVHEQTVDGYSPFEDGFGFRRLRVAVVWQPRTQ
jgi:hypothetical protein